VVLGPTRARHPPPYKKEGVWGSYKAPHFNGGYMDTSRPSKVDTPHRNALYGMRHNGRMPREVSSTKAGRLKAGSRNGLAMPVPKAWKASLAHTGPAPSLDRAVGVDHPELKPWRRRSPSPKGEAPLFRGGRRSRGLERCIPTRGKMRLVGLWQRSVKSWLLSWRF
jgi:hypothetical protein